VALRTFQPFPRTAIVTNEDFFSHANVVSTWNYAACQILFAGNCLVAYGGAEHIVLGLLATSVNPWRFLPLLCSSLLLGCGPPKDQPVLGSVFELAGSGTVGRKAEPANTRQLARGDTFAPGDEIRLQGESIAVLSLTPGIYVRCYGGADVAIEQLSIAKNGDETGNAMHMRRAAVRLEGGRLHILLPTAESSRADFKVHSRFGTLNAKAGSLFSVTLNGDSIRILCARGEVNWSEPPGGSTKISAGYFSDRRAADPSSAAEDAVAQAEIMALLDSAQTIADLETAMRNAPAPWRKQ
jgi:hypothetical protein